LRVVQGLEASIARNNVIRDQWKADRLENIKSYEYRLMGPFQGESEI
jgi:hypothetical protein